MKKSRLYIFFLYVFVGCSQSIVLYKNYYLNRSDMFFDIKRFEEHEHFGRAEYVLPDGTKVKEIKWDNTHTFTSLSFKSGDKLSEKKEYFANYRLQRVEMYLYGLLVGISYEYDENGREIKKVDNDRPYRFSVESFIALIKVKYNADLSTNPQNLTVTRSPAKDGSTPQYTLEIRQPDRTSKIIIINGDTGEPIKDVVIGAPRD